MATLVYKNYFKYVPKNCWATWAPKWILSEQPRCFQPISGRVYLVSQTQSVKKITKKWLSFFQFHIDFCFCEIKNRDNIENIYLKNHHESNYELGYGLFQLIQWHEQKRFLCYLQFWNFKKVNKFKVHMY